MFRAFKTFANKLTIKPKPVYPECHRITCPCVQNLNREMSNILRTSEGYGQFEITKKKYNECYAIYKNWHR